MIEWTRVRLTQWGRWCQGQRRTGYPTASAFVHANEGDRAAYDGADMPPELQEIENAVMDLSWHCRVPVLWYYTRRGPVWWKALQCRVSKTTFLRRVRTAEDVIDRRLQIVDRNVIDSGHSGVRVSGTPWPA